MRRAKFAELTLFQGGQPLDAREKLADVEKQIADLPAGRHAVLLSDREPLGFALRFFALLDHGHAPIVLPPEPNEFQLAHLRASFPAALLWNASELHAGSRTEEPPHGYGCLTSGTLGPPQLCWLGVDGAVANARAHAASLGIRAEHTLLQSLPIHHSFGIVAYLFTALEIGCALDFSPAFLTLRTLKKRVLRHAVLHTSPAQVRFLLKEPGGGVPGLDIFSVGAGTCDPHELDLLRERLPGTKLFVTYGLTEAGPRVTTGRVGDGAIRRGWVGRPLEGVELRVRTDDGEIRAEGIGQLCVRSPSLKLGTETYVTRDTVELSADGDVVFLARQDDIVKVGGVSVYPQEVETVARLHPTVADAAVLKRPDPLYEEVFDLVVESHSANEDELRSFLQARLGSAQWPKRIIITSELPRSALGKVDRKALHARLDSGD